MDTYLLVELCETKRLLVVGRSSVVDWAEPFVTVSGGRRGVLVGEFPTYAQAHDERERANWARRGLPTIETKVG